jgi:hypothetical protein
MGKMGSGSVRRRDARDGGHEPFRLQVRPTGGKQPSAASLPVFDREEQERVPHVDIPVHPGGEVMHLRSGLWPDYDPLALAVLVVGIIALTTWAVGF